MLVLCLLTVAIFILRWGWVCRVKDQGIIFNLNCILDMHIIIQPLFSCYNLNVANWMNSHVNSKFAQTNQIKIL